MTALSVTILWCAAQVTLFLGLAAPVYLAARRLHPRAGTMAALGSLAAVIALSLLAGSPWPRWQLTTADGTSGQALPVASVSPTSAGQAPPAATSATPATTAAGSAQGADISAPSTLGQLWQAVQAAVASPPPAPAGEQPPRWPLAIVALALVGLAIGAVHLLGGLIAVKRLVRRSRAIDDDDLHAQVATLRTELAIARPIALCESAEIATPATVGWRRPVVLLPAAWRTWDEVERESVLAHELAHVDQHDFAAWLVAQLAIVIHFYHPLVRWFARRLQLDQELAADAAAVRLLGNRDAYLHALANLALATPMHRIAGPARAFIPSRSLLIRRVEMLRTNDVSKSPLSRGPRAGRWISLAAIGALALAASGLRSPAGGPLRAAEPTKEVTEVTAASAGYDFAYVPQDNFFVLAIRPSSMAASPRLKPLAKLLGEVLRPAIPVESLAQVTFAQPTPQFDSQGKKKPGSGSEYTVFQTTKPVDFKPLIAASYGSIGSEAHNGRELITWGPNEHLIAYYAPNDHTLISHPKEGLINVMNDPDAAQAPADAIAWQAEAKGPLFAAVNMDAVRKFVAPGGIFLQVLGPAIKGAEKVTVTTEDAEPFVIRATATCKSAEDATAVLSTVNSALVLARNMVESAVESARQEAAAPGHGDLSPATQGALELAVSVLETIETKADGDTIIATATIADMGAVLGKVAIPAILEARAAANRVQSYNNLKQIALAMHLYHDKTGAFPPAVIYGPSHFPDYNATGEGAADVPRSWRVEILPYIEEAELYRQYRLDEPWDSEANRKVLAQMPAIFRAPEDEGTSTNASYFAMTGPGTVFDSRDGTSFQKITDGTTNTLMLAEAKRPIPWTKPEDVAYKADDAVPKLGGWRAPGDFLVAFCDGSVHSFSSIEDETLKRLIEKADETDAGRTLGLTQP